MGSLKGIIPNDVSLAQKDGDYGFIGEFPALNTEVAVVIARLWGQEDEVILLTCSCSVN